MTDQNRKDNLLIERKNIMKRFLQLLIGVGVLTGSFLSHGVVLTFEPDDACATLPCAQYGPIDQSYGDAVGVDVTWGTNDPNELMQYWDNDYSDLTHVGFAGVNTSSSVGVIKIEATGGSTITFLGFDLGSYQDYPEYCTTAQGTDYTDWCYDRSTSWSIQEIGGLILDSSRPIVVGGNHTSVDVNFESTTGFLINWGPDGYDVGIDNIAFSVSSTTVPEPGSLALLGLGLAGLGWSRRKKA